MSANYPQKPPAACLLRVTKGKGDAMTRGAMPPLSDEGQRTLGVYAGHLHEQADLRPATLRNYLSDLRHFAAWCEATWAEGREETMAFTPALVATPTLAAPQVQAVNWGYWHHPGWWHRHEARRDWYRHDGWARWHHRHDHYYR